MKFQGFVGPTYNLKSKNVDCQRCINIYPEAIESGSGKGGAVAYFKTADGLTKMLEVGTGPIRCVHVDSFGTTFIASGSEMYRIVEYYTPEYTFQAVKLGNLGTSTGRITAASLDPGDDRITVFCDGSTENYAYKYLSTSVEQFGTFTSLGDAPVAGATHVTFIDGYLVYAIEETNKFWVSDVNSLKVDALSFASAEANPDKIKGVLAVNRELWIFNEQSIEVWANSGNPDFPFERISGGFIEVGCIASYSIAKVKGMIFWLSQNGSVYAAQGLSPKRISTHAIEQLIQSANDIKSISAFAYEKDGHTFYVLNSAEFTVVYDVTTGLWHERAYTGEGALSRHRADYYAYYDKFENLTGIVSIGNQQPNNATAYSRHYVGDYENNKLYIFDSNVYTDDGEVITRLRRAPHVSNGLKTLFHHSLKIDVETGVGLDGDPTAQGANPKMLMRFSDDGGHTWSNEKEAYLGKIGERKKRVEFRRLGRSRDRVYEIKVTDPVPVTIIDAELELEQGVS